VSEQPDFARAWLRQRRSGQQALEQLAIDDLRSLDAETALARSDALLAATPIAAVSESRRTTSGFVEQQRRFARARR
jgi:hypothetical protein